MMMRYLTVSMALLFALTSCNGQRKSKKSAMLKESINRGAEIYKDFCMNCHMSNGEGVENTYPPLAQSDYLMNNRSLSIKAIKFGQQGEILVNGVLYNNSMSPLGLTNEEIADVMNYITNAWGNENMKMITVEEVSKIEP